MSLLIDKFFLRCFVNVEIKSNVQSQLQSNLHKRTPLVSGHFPFADSKLRSQRFPLSTITFLNPPPPPVNGHLSQTDTDTYLGSAGSKITSRKRTMNNTSRKFPTKYRKILKISPRAYNFQRPFLRAYFWRGLFTEGNLRF